jgi:hypothetical protein
MSIRRDRGEPTHQRLLWIPKGADKPGVQVKVVPPVPYPFLEEPARVWSLFGNGDPETPPRLPFQTVHQRNVFLEDAVHDWNIRKGGTSFEFYP